MTADVKQLLPLPAIDSIVKYVEDYARANVEHRTEALRAEVERLRELAEKRRVLLAEVTRAGMADRARADRLAEVLREAQPFIGWVGSYEELHAKIDALLRDQGGE